MERRNRNSFTTYYDCNYYYYYNCSRTMTMYHCIVVLYSGYGMNKSTCTIVEYANLQSTSLKPDVPLLALPPAVHSYVSIYVRTTIQTLHFNSAQQHAASRSDDVYCQYSYGMDARIHDWKDGWMVDIIFTHTHTHTDTFVNKCVCFVKEY